VTIRSVKALYKCSPFTILPFLLGSEEAVEMGLVNRMDEVSGVDLWIKQVIEN